MKNNLFAKVFGWMFVGLMITFITAYYISTNTMMIENIFTTNLYWVIFIIELVIVVVLSSRIHKMQPNVAMVLFCLYSFISGITFSIIFITFEISSILFIFGLTAGIFGIFSLIGFTTKVDLSKFSNLFFMGLIAIIIASIINMFIGNGLLELIISWVSIILFIGITAYDIQKIKKLAQNNYTQNNVAIIGAFQLYLDFINIFVDLLRIFGNSRD